MYGTNNVRRAVYKSGGAKYVAERLGVSPSTVYNWVKLGYVPKYWQGSQLSAISQISTLKLYAPVWRFPP